MGRFRSAVPIRCRGPIHLYSARDPATDRPLVIATAPRLPRSEAGARLASLARCHELVAGPHVPGVVDRDLDGPAPWVALGCDAIADLETAAEFIRGGGDKPSYRMGAALGKTIMETLVRTHGVRDPDTGAPVCLGSLAASNVLYTADGAIWLVGFGAGPLADACVAPEVALGGPPTPGADVFATTLFVRAQIPFTEPAPAMIRVFSGRPTDDDRELVQLLAWSNAQILAASPTDRPTMAEALAGARRMWQLLGFEPDVAGFSAWVARAVAIDPAPERLGDAARDPGIVVGRDGEWLETNGARYGLATRRSLRRILFALAETRCTRPGEALAVDQLLRAGWPGEDPLPEAGSNRVYVAISTLRKLGLGELLQRWDGGYRLDPVVPCRLAG